MVYFMTKKPNTVPEKTPSTKAKPEQSTASAVPKASAKKTSTAQKAPKSAPDVESKAKVEELQVTQTSPKKSSSVKSAPKKPEVSEAKPVVATPEISAQTRAGLTAGSIWQYLNENGSTSVAKLIKELPEEEKIIQRSIGWLAQEDKITLSIVDRAETIALKD
jgi:predicted DNA-binding transcriptional regulator AlpA